MFEFIEPPEAYDLLLRVLSYAAPTNPKPIELNWMQRVFPEETYQTNVVRRKYKPIDHKVRPVPSYMPNPQGQVLKRVIIPDLSPLPFTVPALTDFVPTECITQEHLELMLKTIPKDFLLPREIDLLVFILRNCKQSIAFKDAERGTFSCKYFPDYEIPVIEHTPWVQAPIQIPKAIEGTV